ncbi:GMC oxidoreductase [Chryseobacterium jejuense]|uniref:Choline dehydrogenase n=1 Tax=Chryseobacterium jejuense TaxID=445960 RepID=A0A2X2X2B8_CHRJE|nr:GMC family oxidoreductase [Chryseobacterium jejuense]SDI24191.1 Choline dehydrogenase [Chryseobacterium jejuense]SQB46814.1 Gluconate 2-dehydrogenase flavoprotein precursor [Chryseobacterium jejuense]
MYDIIIIGTGAGGSTMAYQLADSGKKILILERGDYVPVEKENWSSIEVFQKNRYTTTDLWLDKNGNTFRPGMHYNVGGNTKFYGAALFRLREEDFKEIQHYDGISPAWPIQYDDLKSYYLEAEKLFHVHGKRGSDPTEPFDSEPYPHSALPHEPRIQEIFDELTNYGLHPFELPIGVNFEPHSTANAPYTLDRFDGFPDASERKGDAHLCALSKALEYSNVELMTNAKVVKLNTDHSGKRITEVIIEQGEGMETLTADLVILSAGAINSAAILLQSKNDQFPNGLANSSDQVGRNYMFHQNTALIALYTEPNPTKFGKTFGINDFYHSARGYKFPLGHIQMLGKSDENQIKADSPIPAPGFTFDLMAKHAVDFWLTSEDLPDPENRVTVEDGQIKISYTDNNQKGHEFLKTELIKALKASGKFESFLFKGYYFSKGMDIASPAHQNGTTRMGPDPETSVVDTYCKAHDLENLYIVDGGFFVSSGAVNPALTIIAMALRVGEYLKKHVLK